MPRLGVGVPGFAAFVLAAAGLAGLAATAVAMPPGRNGQIAWMRMVGDRPPDLWVAGADGTAAHKVLSARNAAEGQPAWSPVAPSTLAFIRETPTRRHEVYVGDVATGALRRVTGPRTFALAPSFSPDGARIAYDTDRDFPAPASEDEPPPPPEIYVIGADGTGPRRLTRDRLYSTEPEFSPDGRRILFSEARVTRAGRLLERLTLIDADGSDRRPLTAFGGDDEVNGEWTPDGTRIVFEVKTRGRARSDIAIMDADGGGRRILLGGPGFEASPVPSPDGTRIVFSSDRDRRGGSKTGRRMELYTMAADGSGVTRLTSNGSADLEPDWQRLP